VDDTEYIDTDRFYINWDNAVTWEKENIRLQDTEISERELDRLSKKIVYGTLSPTNLHDLVLQTGVNHKIGDADFSLVRIFVKPGDPPHFTITFPATSAGELFGHTATNWGDNINTIMGKSDLLKATKEALETSIEEYSKEHDVPIEQVRGAPIMVTGLSQGGILAGSFAARYGTVLNIKQVFTFGSPIAHFNIPKSVNILAYRNTIDIVPAANLTPGRDFKKSRELPNWELVYFSEGPPKSLNAFSAHNTVTYAYQGVDKHPPQKDHFVDEFLGNNMYPNDYYFIQIRD
jgi:hypothetical protein